MKMKVVIADHSGAPFTFEGDVKKAHLDQVFQMLRHGFGNGEPDQIPCRSGGRKLHLTKRNINTIRNELQAGTRSDLVCEYQGGGLFNKVTIAAQGDLFKVRADGDDKDLDIDLNAVENGYALMNQGYGESGSVVRIAIAGKVQDLTLDHLQKLGASIKTELLKGVLK